MWCGWPSNSPSISPPHPTPPAVWVLPDAEPVLDPYNNSLAMPLHEWIEHPIAEELLHNGATLQVLGLTNYSYWPVGGWGGGRGGGGWVGGWGAAGGAPTNVEAGRRGMALRGLQE